MTTSNKCEEGAKCRMNVFPFVDAMRLIRRTCMEIYNLPLGHPWISYVCMWQACDNIQVTCDVYCLNDVVEAHCYVVDIGQTDREHIRSRINNN